MGAGGRKLEDYPDLLTDGDLAEIYGISSRTIRNKRLAGTWGPRCLPNIGRPRTPRAEVARDIDGVGADLVRRLGLTAPRRPVRKAG